MDRYFDTDQREKSFWDTMGVNVGYIDLECPNCGRFRVEHWSGGKDVCEKCHWCIQDHTYITNEFFDF